jgi:hypothetical protein
MELLRQTQDADEFEQRGASSLTLRRCPISERAWRRALDVMHTFSERGPLHHRQLPFMDLLSAATAGLAIAPLGSL